MVQRVHVFQEERELNCTLKMVKRGFDEFLIWTPWKVFVHLSISGRGVSVAFTDSQRGLCPPESPKG